MKLSDLILGNATAAPTPAPVARRGSPDLARILSLPRRTGEAPDLTPTLRRAGGSMSLRPIQSQALHEAQAVGGLFGAIGVGYGKTLISLLLPTVLGSRNAVLLIPPQLRDQLLGRDFDTYAKHWRIPNRAGGRHVHEDVSGFLHVVAYSDLSSPVRADILDRIRPDLIVADEAHNLRATSSARTKRFRAYFRKHPQTRFAYLTGTPGTLPEYWHMIRLALGDGAPVPHDYHVMRAWGDALEDSPFPAPEGDLEHLRSGFESTREGFRKRFTSTPGVVATSEDTLGASLILHARDLKLDAPAKDAIDRLRGSWELPDGQTFSDALTFYRAAKQLALGFWLKWTWPRNEPEALRKEWIAARKEWFAEVRDFLAHRSRPGCDSPYLYEEAVREGKVASYAYEAWADIRDACAPVTVAQWVSDVAVQDAATWGTKHTGVIWVSSPDYGEAVAKAGGFPWYGAGDEASAGIGAEDGTRTIVASIQAHGTGKNLQAFDLALVTSCPASAKTMEQLLGRHHREGQKSAEVNFNFYMHTEEFRKCLENARKGARYDLETRGANQRILYANYTFSPP